MSGAWAWAALKFTEADEAMGAMVDGAGAGAVDAGEGHAAEDALFAEESGEVIFVAEAVLESQDGGVVFQQGRDEGLEEVVAGGLQCDDDPIDFGHVADVGVDVEGAGGEREIAGAAFDAHAALAYGVVVAAEEEMDVVAGLDEAGA